jgi:hypothetical protein
MAHGPLLDGDIAVCKTADSPILLFVSNLQFCDAKKELAMIIRLFYKTP